MGLWSNLFSRRSDKRSPRAGFQDAGGGKLVTTAQELLDAINGGTATNAGVYVTPDVAMQDATIFACLRLRSGIPANMPLHIKKRVDDRTREDASDHPLWKIFHRKPNSWQTPSQFKRMMEAHKILRGNAYALIVRSRGEIIQLVPLHPDRVKCTQGDDFALTYVYTRKDGRTVALAQSDVFHLVGLTLDGVNGVSAITYARETIGLSLGMQRYAGSIFKNALRIAHVLTHPKTLGIEGLAFLKASLEAYRDGGESEGKDLILEEGMEISPLSMTHEDAQWIESRQLTQSDIAMIMGVPPHMIGITEKQTSFGTGLEQQTQGFVTFNAEDDLTTWEETINRDLIRDDEPQIYARFNRASLIKADSKVSWDNFFKGRQTKVYSANDVRAFLDMNPVEGGDVYENPVISVNSSDKGGSDEPAQSS